MDGDGKDEKQGRFQNYEKRAEVLRRVGEELGYKFREKFVGGAETVLIEGSKDGQAFGRCERYFMVHIEEAEDRRQETEVMRKNEIVRVRITGVTEEGAEGEINVKH
jgi:tRNA A37 methylthiotransferase MiaB